MLGVLCLSLASALAAFQGTTRIERYEPADWPYVAQFAAALPDLLDVIR